MTRTDATTVKNTFDTDLSDSSVSDWISRASHLVDDVAEADPGIKDSRLKDLETLVAQHLAASQDQRVKSRSGATRQESYQGETGMGFEATQYGQAALELDPTGTLGEDHEFTLSI